MVSLLGDYYYEFPQKQELKIRMKDLLEDNVDEKYYLSDRALQGKLNTNFQTSNIEHCTPKDGIMPTLCARDWKDSKCTIVPYGSYYTWEDNQGNINTQCNRASDENGVALTISTQCGSSKVLQVKPQLMELTKNQSQGNRVYDPNGLSVSLCAGGGGMGAKTGLYLIKDDLKRKLCNELIQSGKLQETDVIRHSYTNNRLKNGAKNMSRIEAHAGLSPTLDTRCDCLGVVVKDNMPQQASWVDKKVLQTVKNNNDEIPQFADLYNCRPIKNGVVGTLSTSCGNDCGCGSFAYFENYRIRKLTPRECFRLMGVKDDDFDKVAIDQSNASLYHLAGDSIVANVLMAIFRNLLMCGGG